MKTNSMERFFYSNSFEYFIRDSTDSVVGKMSRASGFDDNIDQKASWIYQIESLRAVCRGRHGKIYFEYSIPRMGKRIDSVLITSGIIFVLEFKVGSTDFPSHAIDQVWDYALDLKNFHLTSHEPIVVPILVATEATAGIVYDNWSRDADGLISPPLTVNTNHLGPAIDYIIERNPPTALNPDDWENGRYQPTPTIIEAATSLYRDHSVENICRTDASAKNLRETGTAISDIIHKAEKEKKKIICFVTGVPGAGKTLVGLDVATKHMRFAHHKQSEPSVFLSGNGPLVAVLTEVLARDSVRQAKEKGVVKRIGRARSEVKAFIQNVHHYRDEYLRDRTKAPADHVAIFDEAQRAWNLEQTANFMKRRRRISNFSQSEPEFLISCLDRHQDWAVIVCLVGGGQEINRGEAGIAEWIEALNHKFPKWDIYISDRLHDAEYAAGRVLDSIVHKENVHKDARLHLAVSMRSFRAEKVSSFVKALLDIESEEARRLYRSFCTRYPLLITRSLSDAKQWLRKKARGTERYGLLASSSAYRLKAKCINVNAPMNPIHWFLEDKNDVRSSYFLEDVATEFQVQGLELDWACVTWDADFRFANNAWRHFSFVGNRWNRISLEERKQYLKNAYRVLLTRARQGMVIVVPEGNPEDETRNPDFYDGTFEYLVGLGIEQL